MQGRRELRWRQQGSFYQLHTSQSDILWILIIDTFLLYDLSSIAFIDCAAASQPFCCLHIEVQQLRCCTPARLLYVGEHQAWHASTHPPASDFDPCLSPKELNRCPPTVAHGVQACVLSWHKSWDMSWIKSCIMPGSCLGQSWIKSWIKSSIMPWVMPGSVLDHLPAHAWVSPGSCPGSCLDHAWGSSGSAWVSPGSCPVSCPGSCLGQSWFGSGSVLDRVTATFTTTIH